MTESAGKATVEVDCGGIVGQSVKIIQDHNYLTICEVEAYGEAVGKYTHPIDNIARNRNILAFSLIQ